MAYNPGVVNRSGEIYGQGVTEAAKAQAEGMVGAARTKAAIAQQNAQNWAQTIQGLGQSVAGAITKGVDSWQQQSQERDYLKAGMEGLASQGVVSPDVMDKFTKGSLGAQRAIFTQQHSLWDSMLKSQNENQQLERQKNMKLWERQLDTQTIGQPANAWDPTTKQWKQVGTFTSPTGVTLTPRPERPTNMPHPIQSGDYQYGWKKDANQAWVPDWSGPIKDARPEILFSRARFHRGSPTTNKEGR